MLRGPSPPPPVRPPDWLQASDLIDAVSRCHAEHRRRTPGTRGETLGDAIGRLKSDDVFWDELAASIRDSAAIDLEKVRAAIPESFGEDTDTAAALIAAGIDRNDIGALRRLVSRAEHRNQKIREAFAAPKPGLIARMLAALARRPDPHIEYKDIVDCITGLVRGRNRNPGALLCALCIVFPVADEALVEALRGVVPMPAPVITTTLYKGVTP
jgi:hypothetical protein